MQTVLLSMGNDQRRDDGIASALCAKLPDSIMRRLEYRNLGVFGHDLATYIEDANRVIIVDAVLEPSRIGELFVLDQLDFTYTWPTESHGLSWLSALKLMPHHPPVLFVGVAVSDLGWGTGFSPKVQEQFEHLTQGLARICERVLEVSYA